MCSNKGTLVSVSSLLSLLSFSSLVATVGCRNVEVEVDVMPGGYPNLLTEKAATFSVALIAPREIGRHDLESLKSVHVTASSTFAAGEPVVAALGEPRVTDVNGDGWPDLVATFSVAELRLAGLLGPSTTRLSVRATADGEAYCEGMDRLFEVGSEVLEIPAPSGPLAVGTTSLFAVDKTRPGLAGGWRGLVLRLWYPAAFASNQPTTYFLDDREAQANVPGGLPVTLPPTLFDAVHAWSQRDVLPKLGKRPTLLLSTGLVGPASRLLRHGDTGPGPGLQSAGFRSCDAGSGNHRGHPSPCRRKRLPASVLSRRPGRRVPCPAEGTIPGIPRGHPDDSVRSAANP